MLWEAWVGGGWVVGGLGDTDGAGSNAGMEQVPVLQWVIRPRIDLGSFLRRICSNVSLHYPILCPVFVSRVFPLLGCLSPPACLAALSLPADQLILNPCRRSTN